MGFFDKLFGKKQVKKEEVFCPYLELDSFAGYMCDLGKQRMKIANLILSFGLSEEHLDKICLKAYKKCRFFRVPRGSPPSWVSRRDYLASHVVYSDDLMKRTKIYTLRRKRDVEGLIKAAREDDEDLRRYAVEALEEIGDERAKETIEKFRREEKEKREREAKERKERREKEKKEREEAALKGLGALFK